tara:strand:- start:377 stop:649 length:273 start_codon:yes stop_codon:yes gene_type:complete
MILKLTEEEARVLDNELFVAQCKLRRLNFRSVDEPKPSEEQIRYKEVVTDLRVKLCKVLEKEAINGTKYYNKWLGDRFEEKTSDSDKVSE